MTFQEVRGRAGRLPSLVQAGPHLGARPRVIESSIDLRHRLLFSE